MATLKEIKTRIGAVRNTQKITKAMKMVAAAKLRKAQDRIISTRPYARKMNDLLLHLTSVADKSVNPLLQERKIKERLIVIMSSDRGLCGSFNTNIMKFAANYIDKVGKDSKLFIIGKKANDYFRKRNYNVVQSYTSMFSHLELNLSNDIVKSIVKGYLNGEYDSADLIYNEFVSIIKQSLLVDRFLPLVTPDSEKHKKSQIDYIYEPSSVSILNDLIPKQLNIHFWKALLDSNAAELGARMTAMELATQNATELIQHLELIYNRARQESITTELLEIVAGAEALRNT